MPRINRRKHFITSNRVLKLDCESFFLQNKGTATVEFDSIELPAGTASNSKEYKKTIYGWDVEIKFLGPGSKNFLVIEFYQTDCND
jgi:hypothetical protein